VNFPALRKLVGREGRMFNDTISDVLIRIKNASNAKHKSLLVSSSKTIISILKILEREGYIKDFEEMELEGKNLVRINLKYGNDKNGYILGIRRISKPGRRIYVGKDQLPKVLDGFGTAIISTPKGILTDKEARKLGQGGEVICFIW
jgi:small subunit ribosomal protein S8